jgi:NADH-quinone oxidoreductase subunit M
MLVGALYERIHTRDMRKMGGLWTTGPALGTASLFFAMASLGLPGLGNFVAEFLILVGSFQTAPKLTILASLGLVGATLYSLRLIRRAFHGAPEEHHKFEDLSFRERLLAGAFALGLLWLGVYPQPVIDAASPALESIRNAAAATLSGQGNR